jgi:hypothetical protein
MKKEIKEYLEELKEKFADNKYQAYMIKGSKIELLGVSKTKTELSKLIDDNLEDIIEKKGKYIAIILYNIYLKNFETGPLAIDCVIKTIVDGKISKKESNIKTNAIHFTENELEEYKLKKGDYKLLIKGLLDGSIESNPFKIYTRTDFD